MEARPETPVRKSKASDENILTPRLKQQQEEPSIKQSQSQFTQSLLQSKPSVSMEADEEIQVPSSMPPKSEPLMTQPPKTEPPPTQPQKAVPDNLSQIPSAQPNGNEHENAGEKEEEEEEEEQEAEEEEAASDSDLPEFDWLDYNQRYAIALNNINREEDDLIMEFDNFTESFSYWAQASSVNDNERGLKRLKTREVYVQISEQRLNEKKMHYIQVVDAFKSALDLLRR